MIPYPIPCVHIKSFKTELDHLVKLGVLAPKTESEWAFLSFIVPKKDGWVCSISDLHQLNKVMKCKQYLLLIIMDNLRKPSGYQFFTKLKYLLDNEIQNLSTIITLLGKYKHLRPLMGLKCSPDIFQSIKESVLSNIEDEDVYVNGVGAFLKDWKHKHLAKMLY
ncbi:hypothetical protein ACHAW6_016015 [Cyclotella cf. meneghiniana]